MRKLDGKADVRATLMLGSYNPLLIIVIICTVNLPQIKQTNKLKAQTSPAVQTNTG